jgi:hypothetical protein
VRRRLVLSTILVVTIVLLILTLPVTLMLREAATNELSAQKMQEATAVAAVLAEDLATGAPLDLAVTDAMLADGDGVRVLDVNGKVIAERNVDGIDSPYRSSIDGPNGTQVEVFSSGADVACICPSPSACPTARTPRPIGYPARRWRLHRHATVSIRDCRNRRYLACDSTQWKSRRTHARI